MYSERSFQCLCKTEQERDDAIKLYLDQYGWCKVQTWIKKQDGKAVETKWQVKTRERELMI